METITLVKDSIHRPGEPRHFMEYQFPDIDYRATIATTVLAQSNKVLKLCEVGYHIYDPVIYFPRNDTALEYLQATAKSTHCPLKGDTVYYDFVHGDQHLTDIAWSYASPLSFADTLKSYIAFDRRAVTITVSS